jgi:hypothetical protein
MTYFIFLKYLRILEEFRKNPHVKISPKSPPTNFQSLGIFKNQILFGKAFSFTFSPTGPAASRPFGPRSAPGRFFLLTTPTEASPLPPLAPLPPSSAPWSYNGHPRITPPSSIGRSYPPFTPVMAAMKAPITTAARHSWPPPPPSRPYKRVPAL